METKITAEPIDMEHATRLAREEQHRVWMKRLTEQAVYNLLSGWRPTAEVRDQVLASGMSDRLAGAEVSVNGQSSMLSDEVFLEDLCRQSERNVEVAKAEPEQLIEGYKGYLDQLPRNELLELGLLMMLHAQRTEAAYEVYGRCKAVQA